MYIDHHGVRNPRAKLAPDTVRRIQGIAEANGGKLPYGMQTELAKVYGVSVSCIHDVVRGRRWHEGQKGAENDENR